MDQHFKQTFSLVLMAIVDANYKFLYVNVGAQGRISDAGVFSETLFLDALQRQTLALPEPRALPNSSIVAPFMLVGDEAFPLRCDLMKPFPRRKLTERQRIFNCRLSRARRVVENAFGILSSKFRVYKSPIALKTSSVRRVVLAITCLHNFLRDRQVVTDTTNETGDDVTEAQRGDCGALQLLPRTAGRLTSSAKALRQKMADYFMCDGAVSWQWKSAGLPCPSVDIGSQTSSANMEHN